MADASRLLVCMNLNANYDGGNALLIIAARAGHTDIASLLIEEGAHVDVRDGNGATVLMLAAEQGHLEMVKVLVKAGAELNEPGEKGTALLLAETNGHGEVAKYLRSKGAK